MNHFPKLNAMRSLLSLALVVMACRVHAEAFPEKSRYMTAANQLLSLMQGKGQKEMPRQSDPATAPLFAILGDTRGVLGDGPFHVKDMSDLMDICGKSNEVAQHYALAGVERLKPLAADKDKLVAELRKMQGENALFYQDEMVGFQSFAVTCSARQIAPMTEFMAALKPEDLTSVRRAGAMQMRSGIFNMIAGGIISANEQSLKLANRLSVLTTLADNIEPLASVLPEATRSVLVQSALAGRATTDPVLLPSLDKIVEGLVKHRECVGLCAI